MLESKAFESKELRETELGSECLLCLETTLISSSKCAIFCTAAALQNTTWLI